jgi:PIN domain nuclease of toxin-antitoxin system
VGPRERPAVPDIVGRPLDLSGGPDCDWRQTIADPRADVYVSSATIWEAGIKRALGKLTIDGDLAFAITDSGFTPLSIEYRHAALAGALPPHHRDPFDRVLVAQAQLEGLTLVTRDPRLRAYDVPVLPA